MTLAARLRAWAGMGGRPGFMAGTSECQDERRPGAAGRGVASGVLQALAGRWLDPSRWLRPSARRPPWPLGARAAWRPFDADGGSRWSGGRRARRPRSCVERRALIRSFPPEAGAVWGAARGLAVPLRGAHLPRRLRLPLRPRVCHASEGVVLVLPRPSLRPRVLRRDSEGPEGFPAPRGPRALAASRVPNQAGGNNQSPRFNPAVYAVAVAGVTRALMTLAPLPRPGLTLGADRRRARAREGVAQCVCPHRDQSTFARESARILLESSTGTAGFSCLKLKRTHAERNRTALARRHKNSLN